MTCYANESLLELQLTQQVRLLEAELQHVRGHTAKLQALIDHTESLIWSIDTSYHLIMSNRTFHEYLHQWYDQHIELGQPISMLRLPRAIAKPWNDAYNRALQGDAFAQEFVHQYAGATRYYEFHFAPILDEQRVVQGVNISGRDSSSRRLAEVMLRSNEARYRAINEAAPYGVFFCDTEGQCVYANTALLQMLEVKLEAVLGDAWMEFLHPTDLSNSSSFWLDLALSVKQLPIPVVLFDQTVRLHTNINQLIWLRLRISPVIEAGVLCGFVGITDDLSALKKAETAAQDNQHFIQKIADTLPSQLFIYDRDSASIIYTNEVSRQWFKSFNIDPTDISTIRSLFHPDDQASIHHALRGSIVANDGQPLILDFECRLRSPEGPYRYFALRITPFTTDADGSVAQLLGVASDITERKLQEQQIRQLNEQLEQRVIERTQELAQSYRFQRTMIQHAPSIIISLDPGGVVRGFNQAAEFEFGYQESELLGRPFPTKLFDRADLTYRWEMEQHRNQGLFYSDLDILLAEARRGISEPYEWQAVHRSGARFPVELTITPLLNADVLEGFLLIGNNIAARKRSEEEFHLLYRTTRSVSEAADFNSALEVVLRNICAAIGWDLSVAWVPNANHDYLALAPIRWSSNERFQHFYQYLQNLELPQGAGMAGRVWQTKQSAQYLLEQQYWAEWNLSQRGYELAQQVGLQSAVVVPILANDQVVAILEFFRSSKGADNERTSRLISVISTQLGTLFQRKQAEMQLRQSEAKNRALLAAMPDLMIRFTAKGEILDYHTNDPSDLFLPQDAMIGANANNQLPQPQVVNILSATQRAIETNSTQNVEYELSLPKGNNVFEARIAPSGGDEVVMVIRNITERKRIEQRLQQQTDELSIANAELAKAARLKDEFLSSMSHELRTPLTGILAFSEALRYEQYGALNQEQAQALSQIDENSRHLLDLINDILDLSKIEAGKLTINYQTMIIDEICQASIRMVQKLAHNKHLELLYEPCAEDALICADSRRLKQMLVNLLSNAVKFTPNGGRIGLSVKLDSQLRQVALTVWDTGIGINTQDIPKLFRPFSQLDSKLSRQYAGTGLGLALVYHMANLHGGRVELQSEVGVGSQFRLILPWYGIDHAALEPVQQPMLLAITEDRTLNIQLVAYAEQLTWDVRFCKPYFDLQPYLQDANQAILYDLRQIGLSQHIFEQLRQQTNNHPVILFCDQDFKLDMTLPEHWHCMYQPMNQQRLFNTLKYIDSTYQMAQKLPVNSAKQILFAADNLANSLLIRDFLSEFGWEVTLVYNQHDVYEAIANQVIDLLVLDLQLAGGDAIQMISTIRRHKHYHDLPIIALSALAIIEHQHIAEHADTVLYKPLNLVELERLIDGLCNPSKEA
ncbi:PAS domain S-box protein [Herpetosiphon llansteffanensis]|uniref:PAS domain S-box protein n=1 Tax=Herpetosiphon llansteffanensis TaxID=2094568 RepID=UPI000D7D0836|nr:PAS domain S-box protein [Herpetosiphon llansteffanensis]